MHAWLRVLLVLLITWPWTQGRAQTPADLIGTWIAVDGGSGESLQMFPDGRYENALIIGEISIFESGTYQALGSTLALAPTRKIYRRGQASSLETPTKRTFSWRMTYDMVTSRRILVLQSGGTVTELRSDSPSNSPVDQQLPATRTATICITRTMQCAIQMRGLLRPGDTCACSHPVTGIAMDYGRAQ